MNYSYGRSVCLLLLVIMVALFIGYLPALALAAVFVLVEAIQWITEYKKSQTNFDSSLNAQLEGLKYRNEQNKQKGKK